MSMVTEVQEAPLDPRVREESVADLDVTESLVLTEVMERRDQMDRPVPGVCQEYKECQDPGDTGVGLASLERKDSWAPWVLKERRENMDRWDQGVLLAQQVHEEREAGTEHSDQPG